MSQSPLKNGAFPTKTKRKEGGMANQLSVAIPSEKRGLSDVAGYLADCEIGHQVAIPSEKRGLSDSPKSQRLPASARPGRNPL